MELSASKMIDQMGELVEGLTVTFPKPLHPANARLMKTLGVKVEIGKVAAVVGEWDENGRRPCATPLCSNLVQKSGRRGRPPVYCSSCK